MYMSTFISKKDFFQRFKLIIWVNFQIHVLFKLVEYIFIFIYKQQNKIIIDK